MLKSSVIAHILLISFFGVACPGDAGDPPETTDGASASTTTSTTTTAVTTSTASTTTTTPTTSTTGPGPDSETEGSAGTTSTSGAATDTTDTTTTDASTTTTSSTTDASTTTTSSTTTTGTTADTGTTTTTSDTSTTTTTTTDTDTGDVCLECSVSLGSQSSSSLVALPGTEFMGFGTLNNAQIIYALDEVDKGRVIYTGDTNILYKEITDCPLWQWLGDSGDQLPKVLSFGRYTCSGVGNNLGNYPDLTYSGEHLPAQYVDNPAQLAADFQTVIYCGIAATSAAEAQTLVDYVKLHGGGLYLASEYFGFITQNDLNRINSVAMPLGVEFEATKLDWGQSKVQNNFACFPQP